MLDKNWRQNYYIGFDLGVASVGWAVSDYLYSIPRLRGKRLWGVRLFEEADTAAGRRSFRSSRRRLKRRRERIGYLNEIFASEINKVDSNFYQRLKDSFFLPDDKVIEDKNALFGADYTWFDSQNNKTFTGDQAYHHQFPTIWHLRKHLLSPENNNEGGIDIRLFYLAIHHIIKNRGNFLYQGNLEIASAFDELWKNFSDCAKAYGFSFTDNAAEVIKSIVTDKSKTKTDKKREIKIVNNCDAPDTRKALENLLELLVGSKVGKNKRIFEMGENEGCDVDLSDRYEEKRVDLVAAFGEENVKLLDAGKRIYDYGILFNVMKDNSTLSESFVYLYDKHAKDLALLKRVFNRFETKKFVKDFFNEGRNSDEKLPSYVSYAHGARNEKGKAIKHSQAEFDKRVKDVLKQAISDGKLHNDPDVERIINNCEQGDFLPVLKGNFGGVIPNQLHKKELDQILCNLVKCYPIFQQSSEDGYSAVEKIESLLTYRIPYYVGPLNTHDDNHGWLTSSMKTGKVYPWNFDQVIDKSAAATAFIKELTSKCSYLPQESVLPKCSMLYQRYVALNEINNLIIDGQRISNVELKQKIFSDLYAKKKDNITKKNLTDFLKSEGLSFREITFADVDDAAGRVSVSALGSYQKFVAVFGESFVSRHEELLEQVVQIITMLPDEKEMLKDKIHDAFTSSNCGKTLTEDALASLVEFNFSGWGKLSQKLLSRIKADIVDIETGEYFHDISIIDAMWKTNYNFMELLSDRFDYRRHIEEDNLSAEESNWQSILDDSYVSPPVKRSIRQAMKILDELIASIGHLPKKIIIETTRDDEQKPERKESRYKQLSDLYKKIESENADHLSLKSELDRYAENQTVLKSQSLYLYFTQMGKCPYCGETIDIDNIGKKEQYDIDHIIPQSLKKDDSILNNKVLVHRKCNDDKKDIYPLPDKMRKIQLYDLWKKNGLITKEKYQRLSRPASKQLTEDELAGFINRQIVETSQSVKVFAELIKKVYGRDTRVIYSKAGLVSDFRRGIIEYGKDGSEDKILLKPFPKVRELNDYHHAKDAYLNIVVGNAYNTKFTDNPRNFIRESKRTNTSYHMSKFFRYSIKDISGNDVWNTDEIARTVEATMERNDILLTRMTYKNTSGQNGGFYDQQIVSRFEGNPATLVPLKGKDDRYKSVDKYGGFRSLANSHFALIKMFDKKGAEKRMIVPIPILYKNDVPEYICNQYGQATVLLLDRIMFNSLIKLDSYPMTISGSTGSSLAVRSSVQLVLSSEEEKYMRLLVKASQGLPSKLEELIGFEINSRSGINSEENELLFLSLIEKLQTSLYRKRPAIKPVISLLIEENHIDEFSHKSLGEQVYLLKSFLNIFSCNPFISSSADLRILGGKEKMGSSRVSQALPDSDSHSVKLIHQSITGLYEKEIDLWQVDSEL